MGKHALKNPVWLNHNIGDFYEMEGSKGLWQIAYYPLYECGKTGKKYKEPRAIVEQPIKGGIDFREVPLRYLKKIKS